MWTEGTSQKGGPTQSTLPESHCDHGFVNFLVFFFSLYKCICYVSILCLNKKTFSDNTGSHICWIWEDGGGGVAHRGRDRGALAVGERRRSRCIWPPCSHTGL